MNPETLIQELRDGKAYFERSSGCFGEEHSEYAPVQGMLTTAQQVAHVAQSVDWFVEISFGAEWFEESPAASYMAPVLATRSLTKGRAWLDRSYVLAIKALGTTPTEGLLQPIPKGSRLTGLPRGAIVQAITDHTAHHRGILTVYARLCGLTPVMPF